MWIRSWALIVLACMTSHVAHAESIRVRGAAHIDARAGREGGALVVAGRLADDADEPLGREHITLRAVRMDAHASKDVTVDATTDDAGRFRAHAPLAIGRYEVHIDWPGTALVEAAMVVVDVDLARRVLALRSGGARPWLVEGDHPCALDVDATIEEDGDTHAAPNLALTLTDASGARIGAATTDLRGRARFLVDPTTGVAGPDALHIGFEGDARVAPATITVQAERHVAVDLAVDKLPDPERAENGIPIEVHVTAHGHPVLTGNIEAHVGRMRVGVARVREGRADLVAMFATPAGARKADLELAYTPNAPWYVPGAPIHVPLTLRGPNLWYEGALAFSGGLVILWLVFGRMGWPLRRAKPALLPTANDGVVSRVQDQEPFDGWCGQVCDAHNGSPIAGALVAIERSGFGGGQSIAQTHSDDLGTFRLASPHAKRTDTLIVDSPLYVPIHQPLPSRGTCRIALIARRRRVIDRFVAWAKERGRPFDARPEATPAHVRRVADGDREVTRWADSVEEAAFSGAPIDARAEERVLALTPQAIVRAKNGSDAP